MAVKSDGSILRILIIHKIHSCFIKHTFRKKENAEPPSNQEFDNRFQSLKQRWHDNFNGFAGHFPSGKQHWRFSDIWDCGHSILQYARLSICYTCLCACVCSGAGLCPFFVVCVFWSCRKRDHFQIGEIKTGAPTKHNSYR